MIFILCITDISDWLNMNVDNDIGSTESNSGSSDDEHEVFQMMEIRSILLDPYRYSKCKSFWLRILF